MSITDEPVLVNHGYQRHASPFKEVDFLLIQHCHRVIWIRQANKRQSLRAPIQAESARPIRANSQDLCAATGELLIIVPQARQLRAAVGSEEAAQEDQHDRLASIIRETDAAPTRICQFEFPRRLAGLQ